MTRGDLVAQPVSLRTALGTDLPLIVGDKVQLQQVILNLIVNAVEAMGAVSDCRGILTINSERSSDGGAVAKGG